MAIRLEYCRWCDKRTRTGVVATSYPDPTTGPVHIIARRGGDVGVASPEHRPDHHKARPVGEDPAAHEVREVVFKLATCDGDIGVHGVHPPTTEAVVAAVVAAAGIAAAARGEIPGVTTSNSQVLEEQLSTIDEKEWPSRRYSTYAIGVLVGGALLLLLLKGRAHDGGRQPVREQRQRCRQRFSAVVTAFRTCAAVVNSSFA